MIRGDGWSRSYRSRSSGRLPGNPGSDRGGGARTYLRGQGGRTGPGSGGQYGDYPKTVQGAGVKGPAPLPSRCFLRSIPPLRRQADQHRLDLPDVVLQPVQMGLDIVNLLLRLVVDGEVDYSFMLVHFGVPVLAHHDDGGLERGDKGQDQVEQDKRRPVEMGGKTDYVPQHPQNQKSREDDDEAPTAAESGYLVGQAVREAGVPDVVGVETMDDLFVVLLHQIIDFFVNLDASRVGGTGNLPALQP